MNLCYFPVLQRIIHGPLLLPLQILWRDIFACVSMVSRTDMLCIFTEKI